MQLYGSPQQEVREDKIKVPSIKHSSALREELWCLLRHILHAPKTKNLNTCTIDFYWDMYLDQKSIKTYVGNTQKNDVKMQWNQYDYGLISTLNLIWNCWETCSIHMWINLNTGHYVIDNVYYLVHNSLLLLLIFLAPKTDKNIS